MAEFREEYSVANLPKIHQLKAAIANCKQGTLDVGDFYNKLTTLWNELNNHVKVSMCTCKGCECGAAKALIQMYEEDKSHQFLMGLNDDNFSHIRSQLLAQESLPQLDKIFNVVMQEENHKQVIVERDNTMETEAAFVITLPRTRHYSQRPTCKHCGKMGHKGSKCFKIIGYPDG